MGYKPINVLANLQEYQVPLVSYFQKLFRQRSGPDCCPRAQLEKLWEVVVRVCNLPGFKTQRLAFAQLFADELLILAMEPLSVKQILQMCKLLAKLVPSGVAVAVPLLRKLDDKQRSEGQSWSSHQEHRHAAAGARGHGSNLSEFADMLELLSRSTGSSGSSIEYARWDTLPLIPTLDSASVLPSV